MAVKIKYLTANADVQEINVNGGILEGLEYVQRAGITGAKLFAQGGWIDVDSFMKAGREMFTLVEKKENDK